MATNIRICICIFNSKACLSLCYFYINRIRNLSAYINIGTPVKFKQAEFGTDARIQLNDSFKTVDDIRDFVASERETLSEADRQFMTVSIKADENVRMGIISDIKQELRRCSALKIMYSARTVSKLGAE